MPIASAEVIPYSLPFAAPYVTARGSLERREMALLRVRSQDGVEGVGEAVPLALRGGDSLQQVVAELRRFAEAASGIEDAGSAVPALGPPARSAVATALLDLRAREQGLPAWRLLGAAAKAPLRCNATLVAAEPLHVAQQALAWEADGFRTFKLKLGTSADVECVRMVREALGPERRIRVDANAAWGLALALRTLADLEPLGIELAEQPVAGLGQMSELAQATSIPLAADESVVSEADAERAARIDACEYATVKLSKIGGVDPRPIARHLRVYMSSALDGPVGIAAAAHVAQTVEPGLELAHGLATQRLFSSTIAALACELRGDMLHLPEGPGLGIEIDEAALDRHRL